MKRPDHVDMFIDANNRIAYLFMRYRDHQDDAEQLRRDVRALVKLDHVCDPRPAEDGGDLVFVATYAAPDFGQAWQCVFCTREWARIGADFYPAEDGVHVMRLGDTV